MGSVTSSRTNKRIKSKQLSGVEDGFIGTGTGGGGVKHHPETEPDMIEVWLVNITEAFRRQPIGGETTVRNFRVFAEHEHLGDIPHEEHHATRNCTRGYITNTILGVVTLYL